MSDYCWRMTQQHAVCTRWRYGLANPQRVSCGTNTLLGPRLSLTPNLLTPPDDVISHGE